MTNHAAETLPARGKTDSSFVLKLIRRCIRDDREDEARRILLGAGAVTFATGAEALAWAELAEMLGERELGRASYALALGDAAAAPAALCALAGMELDAGAPDTARRLLEQARRQGMAPPQADRLEREIALAVSQASEFTPDLRAEQVRGKAVEKFLRLFRGRQGVYARQWYDRAKDISGYAPIYEPFTAAVAERHLAGALTVGLYPLTVQGTVFFAALDIDIAKACLPRLKTDARYREHTAGLFKGLISQLNQWRLRKGLSVLFENSGYKGIHAWFFFEHSVAAADAIALLEDAAHAMGALPPDLHCEIFPRQHSLNNKTLGNLIKLPLGVHRRSGKKSRLLDEKGLPVSDWHSLLLALRSNDGPGLAALLDELRARRLAGRVKRLPSPQMQPAAPPVAHTAGPAAAITKACAMLGYLAEKADRERRLTFTERRVLLGVLGHVPGGAGRLHHIIGQCSDYSRQITEHYIAKLKGTPLGCAKIRRMLFYLDGSIPCCCALPPSPWEYDTPVAFLPAAHDTTIGAAVSEAPAGHLTTAIRALEQQLAELKATVAAASVSAAPSNTAPCALESAPTLQG
ncbi:MAG: hypothetical protein JW832_06640 [Deltaproteobacteria bacterium]|nr:hypothetical protein [Deltaproteobacteria bacterium]